MLNRMLLTCALVVASPAMPGATPPDGARARLGGSIVSVSADAPDSAPHVVRAALSPGELAGSMDFVVSLRMRDLAVLQGRIQAGQTIPQSEMEARYLPLRADYERVASWLQGQGLTLTLQDRNHTNVFVRGSVATVSAALGVTFARVAAAEGEFSSAVTDPSLPAEVSASVLGITGLQPHLRMHSPRLQETAGTKVNNTATPADILAYYDAPTNYDGTGQTIAIIMSAAPAGTDLTAFWQACGISDSLGNYTLVNVNGGPTSSSQSDAVSEVTLDAEWASAVAPGAKLRVYAIPELKLSDLFAACTQIVNDGGVNVVSYSAYTPENEIPSAGLQAGAQESAQMVAAGITILACSGDGGTNPNGVSTGTGYSSGNPLTVCYPADDPNVTGVGGTTVTFNTSWNATAEVVWSQIATVASNPGVSGGGASRYFSRPSWQVADGVPQGTTRGVPDVCAMAAANPLAGGSTGGLVVLNGADTGYVGTSLATPIWAGIAALIGQYRSSLALPSTGLLNRLVYVLEGTNSFHDITSGGNGAYQAGLGYDLCSGLGSPDIVKLMIRTSEEITAVAAPANPVRPGSLVTMSATSPFPASTYQWQRNGVNIPGATSSVYTVSSASVADDGTYTVVVTNTEFGSVTYNLGTLTVSGGQPPSALGRLINLSCRAQVGTDANVMIAGFVIGGAGKSGTQTVLVRSSGPALGLAPFFVPLVLADPQLTLTNVGVTPNAVVTTNTGWGGSTDIFNKAAAVGAFPWGGKATADSAVLQTLPIGNYTAETAGAASDKGVALVEVYDATPAGTYTASSPRLTNLSARVQVFSGASGVFAGFVIGGTGDETVLIRASGPSLAIAPFLLTGTLPDPQLTLTNVGATPNVVLATNTGWGGTAAIASAAASVGAFPWSPSSNDSAILVTLPPGNYTAGVQGAGGEPGVALVEIYEVK